MKKFFRKIAGIVVTYYCNRLYKRARKMADAKYKETGKMYYVVDHLIRGELLSVIDRNGFRRMKHDAQSHKNPNYAMYYAKSYNLQIIKDGCWYHTPYSDGSGRLSSADIEARRLTFVRIGLYKAKLVDSPVMPQANSSGNP